MSPVLFLPALLFLPSFLPLCFFWLFACLLSTTTGLFSPCIAAAHLPHLTACSSNAHLPHQETFRNLIAAQISSCRTPCPFGSGVSGPEKLLVCNWLFLLCYVHTRCFENCSVSPGLSALLLVISFAGRSPPTAQFAEPACWASHTWV